MAGTYATDLTTMNDGTINNAADEVNAYNAASTFVENDGDIYIQGTSAYSALSAQKSANVGNSLVYDGPSVTIGSGDVFSIWGLWPVPSGLGTFNNTTPGVMLVVGTSLTAISTYVVDGSDTFPFGGWRNYVVDLRNTPTGPNSGGGGTTNSVYGLVYFIITAFNRSVLFSIDALRYGRMTMTATGGTGTSVSYSSPLTSSSANFPQMADYNDYNAGGTPSFGTAVDGGYHVFGQFQEIAGGFLMKGVVSLGVTGGSAVFFDDANRSVLIEDAYLTYSDFNRIEIRNAASTVNMSSMTFAFSPRPEVILAADAPATPRGNWEVVDNATVALDSCTFVDMGTFIFQSNSELTSCIFRRTDLVTQGSAIITSCTFQNSTASASLLSNSINDVNTCTFISDGSNHAIELTSVPATYTWEHETFDYEDGALGVEGTDFTAGSTGNETLYINATSSQDIVITVPSDITVPSIRRGANYNGQITVQVQAKTIDVNVKDEDGNNVSGAFVWINDGTTTIFNGTTDVNGNITQQSYSGSSNSTLRVRQFGKKPFETTLGTATGNVSQLVTLIEDRQQVAVPTLNNTWTINTTAQTITKTSGTGVDTAQDLYEFVMNEFAATSFMQFPTPLDSITATQYEFLNNYTFGAVDNDHKFLSGGSFLDSTNSRLWANVKTIGSLNSGGIYIVQGTEAADSKQPTWWPDGNIDILVKVQDGTFTQSTNESGTNVDGAIWLFARNYGDTYDHFFADLSAGGQTIVALSTLEDPNNQTASATVGAYGVTISSFGTISRSLNGTDFYNYRVEIDGNGKTLAEVYEYLKYATSEDFSITIDGDDGFEYRNADESLTTFTPIDIKQAPFGTFAGGRFFGAQGVFLTNVVGTTFELVDNTGTTRTPPVTTDFQVTGLKDGTEVRLYNANTLAEIAGVEDMTGGSGTATNASVGQVFISGSTDSNTFRFNYNFVDDFSSTPVPIFVVIMNLNYQHIRLSSLPDLTATNQSIPVTQNIDRNYNDPD